MQWVLLKWWYTCPERFPAYITPRLTGFFTTKSFKKTVILNPAIRKPVRRHGGVKDLHAIVFVLSEWHFARDVKFSREILRCAQDDRVGFGGISMTLIFTSWLVTMQCVLLKCFEDLIERWGSGLIKSELVGLWVPYQQIGSFVEIKHSDF